MKIISVMMLLSFVACSSKVKKVETPQITNESFNKEKALSSGQVADFYPQNTVSASPALQDETLDRYTGAEIDSIISTNDPLLELAVQCVKRDFEKAYAISERLFDKYQKIPAYWNQVANCHLNQGANRKALLFYNKALEVKPDYVPALNNIGVLYVRQGQDQKALIAFEKANKESKFAKTPRYNMAKLYLSYGLPESALPFLQGLLSSSPKDVDLLNSIASSYVLLSDYQRALNYYQKIPPQYWNNPEIGLNLALTLKKVGRADDAKKIFNSISKPGSEGLMQYYSSIQGELGDIK